MYYNVSFYIFYVSLSFTLLLSSAVASSSSSRSSTLDGTNGDDEPTQQTWYDCSEEVGITNPSITFSNVYSEPAIVTPDSGQTIFKTLLSKDREFTRGITVDFHQYYKVFGEEWVTFLKVDGINECAEHSNLCPLLPGVKTTVTTTHPPLNPLTPFGSYRSRQIYRDASTKEKLGCVDMRFDFCEAVDKCKGDRAHKKGKGGGVNSYLSLRKGRRH